MKCKHIALSASSCALTFGLFACGDDVINVDKLDSYVTVNSIEDVECSSQNDGAMAFEKNTATMYVCSDGKWVTVSAQEAIQQRCSAEALKDSSGYKFICDGEVIATVTNGTDGAKGDTGAAGEKGETGAAGESGKQGETGQLGASGKDGSSVNADSVMKAVYDKVYEDVYNASIDTVKKSVSEKVDGAMSSASSVITTTVTENVLEDIACKVKNTSTNEETAMMTVTVECNGATSDFEVPVLVPNKNLEVVYSKSVFVRFPALAGNCEEPNRYFQQMASSAKLSILELDEGFNATGKGFTSEMILKKDENGILAYNTATEVENQACGYLMRMQGSFSITNLISSYAKVTTTIEIPASWGTAATQFTFSALVDLDEAKGDTVVLDFLSDFKAARVKNLIDNGSSFEDASKKANEELAVAFGLSKESTAFESTISSKISQEELEVMTLIPGSLMSANVGGTNNSANLVLYSGYKAIFAENGNFNKTLDEKITMGHAYNNEPAKFLIDYLYNTGYYDDIKKFVQKGFMDAYDLPACNVEFVEKNGSEYYFVDSEGYFKAFSCDGKSEVWAPVALNFDITFNFAKSKIEKECTEENEYSYAAVELFDAEYSFQCQDGEWVRANANCANHKEGDIFVGFNSSSASTAYVCYKDGDDLKARDASSVEAYNKVLCTADNEGKLYTDEYQVLYSICAKNENDGYEFVKIGSVSENCSEENFNEQNCGRYPSIESVYLLAAYQADKCSEDNEGAVTKVSLFPNSTLSADLICRNGEWSLDFTVVGDVPQYVLVKALGVCNAKVEKEGKLFKVDEDEVMNSAVAGKKAMYRCALVQDDYKWVRASELDLLLDKVCNSTNLEETATYDGEDYICTEEGWVKDDPDTYCADNGQQFVNEAYIGRGEYVDAACEYKGEHIVSLSSTSGWMNGVDACEKAYGRCRYDNENSASSTCEIPYEEISDSDDPTITSSSYKYENYVCDNVGADGNGEWTKTSSEADFCEKYVKNKKGNDPQNGDYCGLYSRINDKWAINSVYLNGEWVDAESTDGLCTYRATSSGSISIPEDYVCEIEDGNNVDYYSYSETDKKWNQLENIAAACEVKYPNAKIGDKCSELDLNIVKAVSGWVASNTVDAVCSIKAAAANESGEPEEGFICEVYQEFNGLFVLVDGAFVGPKTDKEACDLQKPNAELGDACYIDGESKLGMTPNGWVWESDYTQCTRKYMTTDASGKKVIEDGTVCRIDNTSSSFLIFNGNEWDSYNGVSEWCNAKNPDAYIGDACEFDLFDDLCGVYVKIENSWSKDETL